MMPFGSGPGSVGSQNQNQQSQQQGFQRPPVHNDLAELGVLNGHTGLSAFGAPMGGGDTVMVTPRSGPGEKRRDSAEVKGPGTGASPGTGHVLNRSMRAVIEGSDYDDPYQQQQQYQYQQQNLGPPPGAAAPVNPGSYNYHSAPASGRDQHQQASSDTFGYPASSTVHSREYASTGSSNSRGQSQGQDQDDLMVPTPRAL
jgi:hypothetical protein